MSRSRLLGQRNAANRAGANFGRRGLTLASEYRLERSDCLVPHIRHLDGVTLKLRRLRDQLGWKPVCSELEQIIDSAWRWHSSHPNGYGS